MKKTALTLLAATVTVCALAASAYAAEDVPAENNTGKEVTAYGKPGAFGIAASGFTIAVDDPAQYFGLTAEDFSIKNAAITDTSWSDDFKVTDVSFKEGLVILDVEPFLLSCSRADFMFWNVNKEPDENGLCFDFAPGDLEITCAKNEELNFTYSDITEFHTDIIDDFTDEESNGTPYKLFTPADTGEALPVVVWNHGGGCSEYGRQIIDDPFAASFASAHTQKYFPCYVIAPFYNAKAVAEDSGDRANIVAAIQELIDAGKVDPDRVYVCGQSYGFITSFTYLYENPGFFTAMVALNGGPTLNEDGSILEDDPMWGAAYNHDALQMIADNGTAVMLVQGIGDPLSTPDKFEAVYNELKSLNVPDPKLVWHSYTAEQFDYLQDCGFSEDSGIPAVDPITGAETYVSDLFHNSNRPGAYDTYIKTWLFVQHK